MRGALSLVCVLAACSAANAPPPAASPRPSAAPLRAPTEAAPLPPFDTLPSLDALSARAPLIARGMHAVASGELSSSAPPGTAATLLLRADDAAACVRVTAVAEPAVHAWVTDSRDDILWDVPSTTDTSIARRGPVCVRKGDTVTLHFAGDGPWAARFAAWASP